MQSADSHDVHALIVADSHRHFVPLQAPLTLQILLRVIYVSNRTGIKYPCVTAVTCKININYMYIKYTFVFGNNLADLLVSKVLDGAMLRHLVGNPKRKVLLSTVIRL
jgi:hypothetical protein